MTLALDWPVRTWSMPPLEGPPMLLDTDTCRLVRPDGTLGALLQSNEYLFLAALSRRPGVVIRRHVMERELWTQDTDLVDPARAADACAWRVRDKLQAAGWPRSVIDTVRDIGWRIDVDEVKRVRRETRGE